MVIYLISYILSFFLAKWGHYCLSGIVLLAAALWLYGRDFRQSKNLIHLRGIFSLFWIGGQGLACMKLSRLHTDWTLMTWVCLALAYAGFWGIFEILSRRYGTGHDSYSRWRSFRGNPKPLFHMVCGVTVISLAAFLTEAAVLGYVPLFLRGVPHAYSEFHLTGIHYITVSCVLVPSISVLYFHTERGRGCERRMVTAAIMTGISLVIPMLCVSRFQFVFAVILAGFTYILLQKQFNPLYLAGLGAVVLPVYLILTVARSHDVEYLNGIFEMKYAGMPIFITQPYMYIANNYENFNCMVQVLPRHTFGLKGLFPFWALTGLKFAFPGLINFPIYVNKKELTTLTMFYDSYYDFGWPGVLIFSCILGLAAYLLTVKLRELRNPMGYLLYAQMGAYLMLSFFTTWFSNTTTWFYLILTGLMAVYYHMNEHRR
ncbi:oligosaccharide repeat unit polymerase [bacterium D16-54]|nr:oligosaccharide repeat unit polymerase [bacterium D16-54]RKJ16056.1 oligosaccharide repeat unit polymerase [bacterium D16-56]